MSEEKLKKNRSAAYPAVNLKVAVESVKTLREQLGLGPYSRDSAAKALGYSGVSGTSSARIAALVHFGLLDRRGDAYYQSGLSNELILYQTEQERQAAVKKAFLQPKLFNKLYEAYQGHALPQMLANILSRTHSINERVANEVASTFRESADFAGLLVNGVLVEDEETDQISPVSQPQEKTEQVSQSPIERPDSPVSDTEYMTSIEIEEVSISFPSWMKEAVAFGEFKEALAQLRSDAKKVAEQYRVAEQKE